MKTTSKFALLSLALAASTVGVAVQAASAAVGFTTLELPLADTAHTRMVLPEGWAFFTRSPREAWSHFYAEREGTWVEVTAPPLSAASNAFGLSRETRREGVESGMLMASVPEDAWASCPLTRIDECLGDGEVMVTLQNPSSTPSLCGEIGLVRHAAVPFAWVRGSTAEQAAGFSVPTRYVKARISCRS